MLGNIQVGDGCKIGAGSLVLKSLPPGCTAVGSPATVVKVAPPADGQPPARVDAAAAALYAAAGCGADVQEEPLKGATEPGERGAGEEVVRTWSGVWVPKIWHGSDYWHGGPPQSGAEEGGEHLHHRNASAVAGGGAVMVVS